MKLAANEFVHDPRATLDYTWDWADWLASDETISSAAVTSPDGLTIGTPTVGASSVVSFISGGQTGKTYRAICVITTTAGRVDSRIIKLLVDDR